MQCDLDYDVKRWVGELQYELHCGVQWETKWSAKWWGVRYRVRRTVKCSVTCSAKCSVECGVGWNVKRSAESSAVWGVKCIVTCSVERSIIGPSRHRDNYIHLNPIHPMPPTVNKDKQNIWRVACALYHCFV